MFDALEAALSALAATSTPTGEPVATTEQVDLVSTLLVLSKQMRQFCVDAIANPDQADWGRFADLLDDSARACRRESAIDVTIGVESATDSQPPPGRESP